VVAHGTHLDDALLECEPLISLLRLGSSSRTARVAGVVAGVMAGVMADGSVAADRSVAAAAVAGVAVAVVERPTLALIETLAPSRRPVVDTRRGLRV
jgi:hypothetical protein